MKITAYNEQHHLGLSGATATTAYSYSQAGTALGSNTPLVESGAGTPGSGPQASAWDHVHPALAAGAASFGSNSTRVSKNASAGSHSSNARADHIHDGIGTLTSSASNTMGRGTINLRAGAGAALTATDTDGDGLLDTVTFHSTGTSSGGVTSIAKAGSSALTGAVTLTGGSNVTLTQVGNDISIASTGGSSASYPGSVEGLYQHFKADAITGLANGASVVEWRNSAPITPGMDLITQSGTPTYQTNVVNSLPVVRFGGSAYMKFLSPELTSPSFCFVIVFKLSSIANAYSGILGNGGGTDKGGFFIKSTGKSAYYPHSGSTAYDGTGAITYGTTNWNYTVINCVGLTYDTRRNAVADKSGTSFTWLYGATESTYYLANQAVGSRVMSGDIAEVLIYPRALTSTEISAVETYITGKYAI